jgi:hypothetical protein
MIKLKDILKEVSDKKGFTQVVKGNTQEVEGIKVSEFKGGYSLDDLIGQVKTFDKPKTKKLLTIKVINKLKEKRNKSKSSSNKDKIQKVIDKIEGDYKKNKYIN